MAEPVWPLGEMEHQAAKLFEPQASFWPSRNELSATVEDIEQRHTPVQLPPLRISGFPIKSV